VQKVALVNSTIDTLRKN